MAALPSLRQLKYLVVLARELNFTRAAEACFVSQSTLSTGIKELESQLGVILVERDRQNVALTQAGHEFAKKAQDLLTSAEDLVSLASQQANPFAQTFKLGVIPTIAPFVLPRFLDLVRDQHPLLKFALREDLTENLLNRLHARQLDFAIIALPYETEGLICTKLFDDEFWLAALNNDPAIAGKRISLPAKLADRLLLLEEGHCLREHTLHACRRSEIASHEAIEATSLLTLVQMVASGLGIALIPEMAVRGGLLTATEIIARPLEHPAPKRTIALVCRNSNPFQDVHSSLAEILQSLKPRIKKRRAFSSTK